MPINKAVLAAFKAASRLKPDVKSSYQTQRVAEDISARLKLADPRCRIEDLRATMSDGYELPLRLFTPRSLDISLTSGIRLVEDNRGTILFFHGGGWVTGDVDVYLEACATMAIRLDRRVIAVDYRRAPEHRFPQAPEDCYEVAMQLHAGTLVPDVDPGNIVLFGDSAGGNLAAVVSLMLSDRHEFVPRAQMLLYPATYNDHSPASVFESVRTNGEDYLLTSRDVDDFMELYRSSPEDKSNPYYAPLLAHDLTRQPRTLVITAEYCPLRDEGEAYAVELARAGTEVECYRILDAVHGYLLHPMIFDMVIDTYVIIKHFLEGNELIGRKTPSWIEIPTDV